MGCTYLHVSLFVGEIHHDWIVGSQQTPQLLRRDPNVVRTISICFQYTGGLGTFGSYLPFVLYIHTH